MSGIATAIVGTTAVTSYLASEAQKDAADTAADASNRSTDLSIAENQRQFDALQELMKPYIEAGSSALTQQQALIGLGGPEAEKEAIAGITRSPTYNSIVEQGEDAILQNASATGGLRGGNVQRTLSEYRPAILQKMLDDRFNKLGVISSAGQASAVGQGNAGMQVASNTSNILDANATNIGNAALFAGNATSQMWGDVAGSVGTVAGMSKGKFGTF